MGTTRTTPAAPAPSSPASPGPAVDSFALAGIGKHQGIQLQLSVSAQLMQNQLPASPIQPSRDIVVVQDSAGQPMIFAIGTDRAFHLLVFDQTQSTGFRLVDLTAGFSGYATAAAFDVTQDLAGRISVVVALAKQGAAATDLFVASMLSNDPAKTDWSKLGASFTKVDGVAPTFVADGITLGVSDDGSPAFVAITGAIGSQEYRYQIVAIGKPATKLEFPENVGSSQMMSVSPGYAFGQRGVWFLYGSGASETLECTTLATADEGSLTYDFSPGAGPVPAALRYNCVATTTGSRTNPFDICSDVYVGCDGGIYLFPNAAVDGFQKVTDAIADVHEILVTQDADNVAIWAICSPSQLYYIAGKKGATYSFNAPILFSQSVVHVAPIRSAARKANELFVVNQDLSVTHHWQDPKSTLWQERLIKIQGSSSLVGVNSFTTQAGITDDDGNPIAGEALRITASEWTYVTINGLVYSLDVDNAASVPTDVQGNVTIIGLTADIASPIFHVRSDVFSETINVYPDGGIQKGLAAVQSGADLKAVKTTKGPLVDPSTPQSTLDGVAANLSQLTGVGAQYVVGTRPPGTTFVAIEPSGAKHTGKLDVRRLPADFAVAMRLQGGVWQHDTTPLASTALVAATANLGGILDWPGDILHWLETAFVDGIKLVDQGVTYLKDGVSFVIKKVEEGLQFVLTIADKVLNVALESLGAVFKVLNWVLKLVGVDLQKILAWLGHLFGWDDIWNTHKVIAGLLRSGLDYAVAYADSDINVWRAKIATQLDGLESKLDNLVLPEAVASASPRGDAKAAKAKQPAAAPRSPSSSFASYQLQHGNIMYTPPAAPGARALAANAVGDPFVQFVTDVLQPTVNALLVDLQKDLADVARLCSPSATTTDVLVFARDLIDTVLDPLKKLVDGLLVFLEDIMGDVRDALQAKIEIPFLGDLYEFVTGLLGDEEDFTFINGAALLLAIPLVEGTKALGFGAPLADDSHGLDDAQLFTRIIGPLPGPKAQAQVRQRAAFMAAAAESSAAREYSRWGGLIGIAAAVAEAGANLLNYAEKDAGSGAAPIAQTKQGLNGFQKAALAFGLIKFAGTFPVRDPDQSEDAFAVKVTSWVIALVATLVGAFLPAQAQSILTAVADAVVFIFSLVGDGLGHEDWLTWVSDILSNLGGVSYGTGEAIENGYATAIGYGVAALGCVVALIHVFELDDDEVLHAVNVGG